MVMKVVERVNRFIYELGEDGLLIKMQLEELIDDIENEELLIIKDYKSPSKKIASEKILEKISNSTSEELLDSAIIAKILGYDIFENYDELAVYPKGYRVLNKIPRMPINIINNLVSSFKTFQHILLANIEELDTVEGIGEVRAKAIKQSLKRMQEQFVFDNLML
jgi:diadenylate cyclase